MNKTSLLGNILIFLISAVMIFISVEDLGTNNLMVGITGLFLLIAILNKDFSKTPIRAVIKISFLTAFIGIVPYLVNANMYIGFFINFIAVFIMIYLVVYTLNKTIYFPFLFGYTLLLTTNVTGKDLYFRVGGLIVVGIIAVIFQIIFLKIIRKPKDENKNLLEIVDSLILNINTFSTGNLDETEYDKFKTLSTKWSRDILEKRNNSFYLNRDENIELDLIASLEHIGDIAKDIRKKVGSRDGYYKNLLLDTSILLVRLKGFLSKAHSIKSLDVELERIRNMYNENKEELDVYEMMESIKIIDHLTDRLLELEMVKFKVPKLLTPKEYTLEFKGVVKLLFQDFNRNSVRFIFAFRTALLVAGAYFIIQFFDLHLGKWMMFTITSVSQPYNNTVRKRAFGRIIGTVIGVIIYVPLSMIFVDKEPRIIIIAIAVYLMISFKDYLYSTAMLTVLFLGVVTIDVRDILLYAGDRVMYIAFGIIAVIIANKIIFPYSFEKETKKLVKDYYNTSTEILEKTMIMYEKKDAREEIKGLIVMAKGIENKMIINNTILDNDKLRGFRNEQRLFIRNIHNVLNRVDYVDSQLAINGEYRLNRIKQMRKELEKVSSDNFEAEEIIVKEYCKDVDTIAEKLIYIDIYEMIKSHKKSGQLVSMLIDNIS
ncbi:MAG: FUSC family protein [Sarcina sp.]